MKKLLLVEDDRLIASIYKSRFSTEGFAVEIAPDAESALQSLKKEIPALALVDLMLPGVNGVEVIKFLRAQAGGGEVPVIVFSNSYLSSLIEAAWKAGASRCLTKHDSTPRQVVEIAQQLVAGLPAAASASPGGRAAPVETPLPLAPQEFLASLCQNSGAMVGALRSQLQSGLKTDDSAARAANFQELFRKVHSLTGNAGLAGLSRLAQLCSALEALLNELIAKPEKINPSIFRTMAQAFDVMPSLFATESGKPLSLAMVLVVDDEKFSRQAVVNALGKAQLRGICVDKPSVAIELAAHNPFDLVFLDVEMPEMTGFDLAAKLRATPLNKEAPIVFVTSLSDFETKRKSVLSGGLDQIGKPFLMMELAVKALTYLLKSSR